MTPLRDAAENATAGVPVVRNRWSEYRTWLDQVLTKVTTQTTYEMASAHLGEAARKLDSDNEALLSELDTARAEIERLREALTKIDEIRNSIIGYQAVNWSAHVYPIVAALHEAGFDGVGYEKARAEAETQVEYIASLTSALTAAQARIAELEGLVEQADAIFTNCTVSGGVCGCGESMENHSDPMSCGHSPSDHGAYVADLWLEAARATLSPAVKEPK